MLVFVRASILKGEQTVFGTTGSFGVVVILRPCGLGSRNYVYPWTCGPYI